MSAFHGDTQMQAIVDMMIVRHRFAAAVETGSFHGDTAAFLSQRVPHVTTIEVREDHHEITQERFIKTRHVHCVLGDGGEVLGEHVRNALALGHQPVLVFLDSHWQDKWPLKDELAALADIRKQWPGRLCVIVDDLRVPGCPNFQGCDGGGGTPGHETYGPKTFEGGHPADITGFPELRDWPELWWPCYPDVTAGYAIVSDIALNMHGLPVVRD